MPPWPRRNGSLDINQVAAQEFLWLSSLLHGTLTAHLGCQCDARPQLQLARDRVPLRVQPEGEHLVELHQRDDRLGSTKNCRRAACGHGRVHRQSSASEVHISDANGAHCCRTRSRPQKVLNSHIWYRKVHPPKRKLHAGGGVSCAMNVLDCTQSPLDASVCRRVLTTQPSYVYTSSMANL